MKYRISLTIEFVLKFLTSVLKVKESTPLLRNLGTKLLATYQSFVVFGWLLIIKLFEIHMRCLFYQWR